MIAFSSWAAYEIRSLLAEAGVLLEFSNVLPAVVGVLPLWLLIFYYVGAYRPEYLNSGADTYRRFTAGVVGGVLALGFLSFFFRLLVPRVYVGLLTVFVFVLGGVIRAGAPCLADPSAVQGPFRPGLPGGRHRPRGDRRDAVAGRGPDWPATSHCGYLTDDAPDRQSVDGRGRSSAGPPTCSTVARAVGAGLVLVAPAGLNPAPSGT